jgi:manganese-dependent ADP-ribose/CDP-alcohol diphosphatase
MRILIAFLFALIISDIMPANFKTRESSSAEQDKKPLFSFGIIADAHYCNCDPVETRYYRSSLSKLKEAVRSFRIDSPKFVVNLGDIIDKDFESYKPVFGIFDTAGFMMYHLTGNHDYAVESRYKKRIPPLQSNKDGYYSFKYGKYRFIVLNGNEISTYATNNKSIIKEATDLIARLKNKGEINAIDWNGGISKKQLDWLTGQLNNATMNNEYVFILCHFPVWPENEHNLLNYKDVLSILEKYSNIIAWFNGHNHMGNYGNFNMIHFVTFKGMVETEADNSFALVEVYNNKIWIKGSGKEKSQIMAY